VANKVFCSFKPLSGITLLGISCRASCLTSAPSSFKPLSGITLLGIAPLIYGENLHLRSIFVVFWFFTPILATFCHMRHIRRPTRNFFRKPPERVVEK